ncbi:MAG: hypothetical protein AB8B95_09060 [Pseudohongiellaceae bacterium]
MDNGSRNMQKRSISRSRVMVFFLFLISVNLLSGGAALAFNYPSLFNIDASFSEYAVPLPFTWALAHWPSMLIYGLPLLTLSISSGKWLLGYRWLCLLTLCLLFLQWNERNPFVLFPSVDATVGLLFSLVLAPPNRVSNPVLYPLSVLAALASVTVVGFTALDYYQHRTPVLRKTAYVNGSFKLSDIEIHKALHEMRLSMELTERLNVERACSTGQQVANEVLRDYPFDKNYNKLIQVRFNPANGGIPENDDLPYPLGEISLNSAHIDSDGNFPCYLRYK